MPRKTQPKPAPSQIDGPPIWMEGLHAGYDPETKQYRSASGARITARAAQAQFRSDVESLGNVFQIDRIRESAAAQKLEHYIAGGFSPYDYGDAAKVQPNDILPVPGPVQGAYRLAEFYYLSEGDVAASIETAIQLSLRDVDVRCPDPKVKEELEAMYDVDGLNLRSLIRDMWLSLGVYGVAHAFEAWDGNELRGIFLLPPRYTAIGSSLNAEQLAPPNGDKAWSEATLKTLLPVAMYDALMPTPGVENVPQGRLILNDGLVKTVRGLDQRWKNYPKVPMFGAFRALSTRLIYEEMRRAIYEGFKYQLWYFALGDHEHRPSPALMAKLIRDVEGLSKERTGNLAWWGSLDIKVLTPNTDSILSHAEWWALSLDIFRRLGASMRVSTGNVVGGEREGTGYELDVTLMLEKYEFMRGQLLEWERRLRLDYAKRTGSAAFLKAARQTKVVFALNMMEIARSIKERLMPIFMAGGLSVQSLLTQANQNYEAERANKLAIRAAGEEEIWFAPPTYSQTTTGIGGDKTSSVTDTGLSKNGTAPVEMRAQDESEEIRKRKLAYLALILAAYHQYASEDPPRFIARLEEINREQLGVFADMGYRQARGMQAEVPRPWGDAASGFVNSFAGKFLADLLNGAGQMDYRRRALMYGEEGYRTAFLHGIQAAMAERGATHWRRVLHPEDSKSGPCSLCVADSQVLHSIDEPFLSLHPNEVCTAAPVRVQFSANNESAVFGIPGITENEFSEFLRQLGPVENDVV